MSTSPAAAVRARVLSQARFDAANLLRNGEQLLVSVLLPLGVLLGLALTSVPDLGPGRRIDVVVPGVLALAVISTSFTGQAIQTGFDRRYGVLRLLGTTPLGRDGLLAGRVLAVLGVQLLQVAVLAAAGLALGWRPALAGLVPAALFLLVGTAAFVSLALLLAGTLRAEAVLALANLVWVALLVLGGVVVPPDTMGPALGAVAGWLPSGALADGLRAALGEGRWDLAALAVLTAWGVGAAVLARRLFRWSD